MRVAVFSTHRYERDPLAQANADPAHGHELVFLEHRLTAETAVLVDGAECASLFANDLANAEALAVLREHGVRLLALRSAGFNHVDLVAAERLGLTVARVPAYSPHAIAEHAVALILTLNRRIHRAFLRVREQNFELDGLMGFDLHGKTVGVIGTGRIGANFARIMHLGFRCRVVAFDPEPDEACRRMGVEYLELDALWPQCDIVALHCPLTPATHHIVDDAAIARMKPGVMLINTSRGAVVDSRAVIRGLKSGHIAALGLDVYEEEGDLFFRDLSEQVIQDDVFVRLMTFPNVLITAHQAFFTREALDNIAQTTVANITAFARGAVDHENLVTTELLIAPRPEA